MTTLEQWFDIQTKTIKDSTDRLMEAQSNKDLFLIQLYTLKKQIDSAIGWLENKEKFG